MAVVTQTTRCRHCGKECHPHGLVNHEQRCVQNPARTVPMTAERRKVLGQLRRSGGRLEAKDFGDVMLPARALGVGTSTLAAMEREGLIGREVRGRRTIAVWLTDPSPAAEPAANGNGHSPDRRAARGDIRDAVARGAASPTDIAGMLGRPVTTIHATLYNMVRSGELVRVGHAQYALPGPGVTPAGRKRRKRREGRTRGPVTVGLRRDRSDRTIGGADLVAALGDNQRIAQAIELLFPAGVTDMADLIGWIDLTRKMLA